MVTRHLCGFLTLAKIHPRDHNKIVKTEVCVNYAGGARISTPSERYVLSLYTLSRFLNFSYYLSCLAAAYDLLQDK